MVMDDSGSIGGRVREVRKRRGLTQRELADAAGVSVSLVSKLEQGERQDVRLETLRKLAVALRVPTSVLAADAARGREAPADVAADWEPVRRALADPQPLSAEEPP